MRLNAARYGIPTFLALALAASPAHAAICDTANEPSATVMAPYFEVDLNNNGGAATTITINNASAAATLVHMTVWSDLAVPVLEFNIYLTGLDQQTISMNDIIVNGSLPQTASTGQDPSDTISPKGVYSQDTNYASCNGILPPPQLPAIYIQHLENSLTGRASSILGGKCAGRSLGDNIARGYVTLDAVSTCTLSSPGDPGYFGAGGTGSATDNNVLFGDEAILNAGAGTMISLPLVHVQASSTDARVTTTGNYTFYGARDGFTALDNRSPLGTTYGVRYSDSSTSTTQLIVWRDPKVSQAPFTCPAARGVTPAWFPLGQEDIVVFDPQEHAYVPTTDIDSPGTSGSGPFPAAVQRTQVGGPLLPVPFSSGWVYLNLNTHVIPAGAEPPGDPSAAQAWVAAVNNYPGVTSFTSAVEAAHFDSACMANHSDPNSP